MLKQSKVNQSFKIRPDNKMCDFYEKKRKEKQLCLRGIHSVPSQNPEGTESLISLIGMDLEADSSPINFFYSRAQQSFQFLVT